MKKTNKKGFTLVELLVVIAILAILATVSVVGYLGFTQKARESKAQTELVQLRDVLTGYLLDSESTDTVYMDTTAGTIVVTGVASEPAAVDAIRVLAGESGDLDLFIDSSITLYGENNAPLSYEGNKVTIYNVVYTVDGAAAIWNIKEATVETYTTPAEGTTVTTSSAIA